MTYAALTADGRARLLGSSGAHLRGIERHFARHVRPEDAACIRAALMRVLGELRPETAARLAALEERAPAGS